MKIGRIEEFEIRKGFTERMERIYLRQGNLIGKLEEQRIENNHRIKLNAIMRTITEKEVQEFRNKNKFKLRGLEDNFVCRVCIAERISRGEYK